MRNQTQRHRLQRQIERRHAGIVLRVPIRFAAVPEHTARARELMGADPLLLVEHKVIIDADPESARAKARAAIAWYIEAEHYVRNLIWLGFAEEDCANGGSDRLIDALVLWGDEQSIVDRLRAHHSAGADHVAIHPVGDADDPLGITTFARLAPLLG